MKIFQKGPFLSVALAALTVLGLNGCGNKSAPKTAPRVPVVAQQAVSMDIPLELRETGTVAAFNSVIITARVGGQLVQVGFKEGRDVSKGDLLFKIDQGPFEAALAQA
ncbi:MAG: biotin/lipoyl-binding protein, partial [Chitinivibrionales bacterium]|nr:biotin/lipoyl-binding protein [Chitinivibrionales bacterium]